MYSAQKNKLSATKQGQNFSPMFNNSTFFHTSVLPVELSDFSPIGLQLLKSDVGLEKLKEKLNPGTDQLLTLGPSAKLQP